MKSKLFSLIASGLFIPLSVVAQIVIMFYFQFMDSFFLFSNYQYLSSFEALFSNILPGIIVGILIALIIRKYQSFLFLIIIPTLYVVAPIFISANQNPISTGGTDLNLLFLIFLASYILSIKAFTKKYQSNENKENFSMSIIKFTVIGITMIAVAMFIYTIVSYAMNVLSPFTEGNLLLTILKWVFLPMSIFIATVYDIFSNGSFELLIISFLYPLIMSPIGGLWYVVYSWDDLKY